jgi:ADP-heptose:LPS heptosyltransferase
LGNQLLTTPLIQDLAVQFPACRIDLFVKGGLGPVLFSHHKNVGSIIALPKKTFRHLIRYLGGWIRLRRKHYDLAINVIEYSSSGKIATRMAQARHKCFGGLTDAQRQKHADANHVAKQPVYAVRDYLSALGFPITPLPVPPLSLELTSQELDTGKALLQELVPGEGKTICLFTYATGEKCFPGSWWHGLYRELQEKFPGYRIIEVLPKENISMIDFQAPTFYSQDIRQIGALIAQTAVFIGADSGMMHLASAVHLPVIGLFSVTNPEAYGPYGFGSIAITIEEDRTTAVLNALTSILEMSGSPGSHKQP